MNMTSLEHIVENSRFTILLGKNGAGKSTRMRELDSSNTLNTKYISPERGGTLKYDPNVDNNIATNQGWLENTRRQNRFEQFRQQSAAQFRTLEVMILREIERNVDKRKDHTYTFDRILGQINSLLPAICLVRSDKGFSIQSKDGEPIPEENISSGESELIALAIEVLVFSRSETSNKILLLDEPDVHLHPDLQQRFIAFVELISKEQDMKVVISTHSTAIISAFSESSDLTIVPVLLKCQSQFSSFRRSSVCDEILPIFGAHPLSSVFNRSPVVLVEGEDDKRVLERAIRSSNGRFRFSPCVVGTVSELHKWEDWLNQFLPVLYDDPKGYSLRDLDDSSQCEIQDHGVVCRIRINCYSIENLLLTEECLDDHGFTEETFKHEIVKWKEQFNLHKYATDVSGLIEQFSNRRIVKVKNIRNILVALLGTNKEWEVVVGQLIAKNIGSGSNSEHSINHYLGSKAIGRLFS
jgi:energy-coupling factor transporter ATP-binding protein EcfA2